MRGAHGRQSKLAASGSFASKLASMLRQIAAALTLATLTCVAHADVQYAYDGAGRLVQVTAADGSSAIYSYDEAGNIVSIERFSAGQLALSAFTPATGPAGSQVVIHGSGFSTTPSANAVSFNGAAAAAVSAAANKLTVTVPSAATTGPISVTVAGNTVTSSKSFVVAAAPSISGFSPAVIDAGGTVTTTGSNFSPIPGATSVTIANTGARIASESAAQLVLIAANVGGSGPITVTTPYGQAVSPTSLVVMPPAIASSNVSASAELVPGGPAQSVSVASSKYGVFAFAATQGQYLSIQVNSLTTTPSGTTVTYQIYSPSAAQITSGSISGTNSRSIHLPRAATSDTYLATFTAGSATVAVSATLELNPTLTPGASPTSAATAAPNQSKRFVMPATTGAHIGVGLADIALTPNVNTVSLVVDRPNGAGTVSNGACSALGGNKCGRSLLSLPDTGDYLVTVSPPAGSSMAFTAQVSEAVDTSLSLDTPFSLSLPLTGQFAMLPFTATAGQTVALRVGSIVTSPSQPMFIAVYNPSGTQILNASSSGTTLNLRNLVAGTYKLQLSPVYGGTGSAQVTLATGVAATVPVNGSASTYSTTVPAQGAYFTFAATAGEHIGVGLSSIALTPSGGSLSFTVLRPDGGTLNSATCSPAGGTTCGLSLVNVPQTGNYQLIVTTAGTTSFSLVLSQAVSTPLTLDTPLNLSLPVVGQFAMLPFTATAGQTVAINVSSISTTPNQPVFIAVYNPSGAQVLNTNSSSSATINLTNLVAGTYKVQLSPFYGGTASAVVKLATGVAATVPVDGTGSTFSTTVPAQIAYLRFAATAGQNVGVGLANLALTPSVGNVSMVVRRPDGNVLSTTGCSPASGAVCGRSLLNLPQTGTYLITLTPSVSTTMSFTLHVSPAVNTALTVGTPLSLSLPVAGQFAMLPFTATSGQSLTLSLTSISTSPGQSVHVAVFNASGTQIASNSGSGSATLNLTSLAAGTYTVQISPFFGGTASAQVTLN